MWESIGRVIIILIHSEQLISLHLSPDICPGFCSSQGCGRFFSEANKSPCFILIQPNSSHPAYTLYISYFEKNIPGTGSGQWTEFYFPLNYDTLQIRKAIFSVTGKKAEYLLHWKKLQTKNQRIRGKWQIDFRLDSCKLLQGCLWHPPSYSSPSPSVKKLFPRSTANFSFSKASNPRLIQARPSSYN